LLQWKLNNENVISNLYTYSVLRDIFFIAGNVCVVLTSYQQQINSKDLIFI